MSFNNKILNILEVSEKTNLCPSSIKRLERNGEFPARINVPKRFRKGRARIFWLIADVDNYIAKRQKAISDFNKSGLAKLLNTYLYVSSISNEKFI